MNWQIQIPIPEYPFSLSRSDRVFTLGSCFAQHMADRLLHYKFSCASNSYGTLFHPIPLLQNLTDALKQVDIDEALFLERDETAFHYSCHSSVWAKSKNDLKKKLQDLQSSVAKELKESKLLILTFGTAFLYQLVSGKPVANCHKQPKDTFIKGLSSPEEIQNVFYSFYTELKKQNPKIQILLTVSPVRHIRDGVHENNLSKSALLLACDAIQNTFEDLHYLEWIRIFHFTQHKVECIRAVKIVWNPARDAPSHEKYGRLSGLLFFAVFLSFFVVFCRFLAIKSEKKQINQKGSVTLW